ncbi:fumarylacetoacetate hydrolase family protein [Porticoccaceae bacterium]|nr:fumarylacetoacetate hydrolase family protein [Porticoccaceae bacterium]MDA8663600.1 fumarylacetoacetate hydrolase family protein [Porticoccaceae bacterium]MDA8683006.1 fumarylacetoacetate hydrolase family protein [Porticoccaceae bacterium]MDB2635085.1 fumarylacetoacetate hydrolase family protein [Porticoccaceae bacterium]
MIEYRHVVEQKVSELPVGKVVCVGRNYADHARELNNPVPTAPVLFIKPSTSLAPMQGSIEIPSAYGECHFEAEMSILIGDSITRGNDKNPLECIAGIGLSLDLTLRDLQQTLKSKGLPWEKAKAFDGACPTSTFLSPSGVGDLQTQYIKLYQNNILKQNGNTADMMTPVESLLTYISQYFSLMPGDLVLTGTPAGVGALAEGDNLCIELSDLIRCDMDVSLR